MRLFLRNGPPVHYGKIMAAESASQPITSRHFTGSDACHIIITIMVQQSTICPNKISSYSFAIDLSNIFQAGTTLFSKAFETCSVFLFSFHPTTRIPATSRQVHTHFVSLDIREAALQTMWKLYMEFFTHQYWQYGYTIIQCLEFRKRLQYKYVLYYTCSMFVVIYARE
jgi:hypothetical protein